MSGQGLEPVKRFLVKGIAGGIGLASESVHAYKERKRQEKASLGKSHSDSDLRDPIEPSSDHQEDDNPKDHEESLPVYDDDEAYWQLDDAQDELSPPAYTEKENLTREDDVAQGVSSLSITETPKEEAKMTEAAFIRRYPAPPQDAPKEKLPLPVILPQRRPKNRARGFIRAYAPVLDTAGINQDVWMDFLGTFHQSSQASPWLNAINLAGIGTIFLPHVASILVGLAITVTVQVAMDVQNRKRTNTFLDKVNDEFFRPRGLFCLVMTYKPDSTEIHETVNLAQAIHSTLNPHGLGGHVSHTFRNSAGKTYGEMEFPEAAPLIFPELDKLADQSGADAERKKSKMKAAGAFVDNYWDMRAQARYAQEHPDSLLVQGPKPEFRSRYADPNHPASSGSFISLVTGGHINPPPMTRGFGGIGGGLGYGRGMGRGFGGGLYNGSDFGIIGGRRYRIEARREGRREALESRAMMGGGGFGGRYVGDPYMSRGFARGAGYDARAEAIESRRMMGGGPFGRSYARDAYMDRGYAGEFEDDYASDRNMMSARGNALAARGQMGLGGIIGFGGPVPIIKKVFQNDVLYLMVVNMPSDEELAVAMAEIEKLKKH